MSRPIAKASVLIVDDVPANLLALEAQLEDLDCEVVRAATGNEALGQLLKREYAVMLLDVQMPEMDGFEVARYARDNPVTRDVPIIFLTAMLETEENALRGYGTGAVDVLFKPINGQILKSKVQIFLDLYRSRRQLADEVEAHTRTMAELEAFNYSVSHDLRAPLRTVDGFSQALLEDYGEAVDDTARDYLKRIRQAAQRMSQLIDELLNLARIGRAAVQLGRVDLSGLARRIVDGLRRDDPTRNVEFVTADLTVRGDPQLLRIALENLLRNAWKFTGTQAAATIELGARTQRGETEYFLKDNGVGFDLAFAKRLFQPFQRFHTIDEFEGTGIGLAIVERIIRHHGGRIRAESAPGSGATFFFTLGVESELADTK
ncbi:MAG: Sensory box histidine kinase [Myxococcaceae bacterium]|nr:Sensory box histidine kinase [Myxococcaceae bacterium]